MDMRIQKKFRESAEFRSSPEHRESRELNRLQSKDFIKSVAK